MVTHSLIIQAFLETLMMVIIPMGAGIIGGIPLGMVLFNISLSGLNPKRKLYEPLSFFLNILRSFPFIILIVALIPLTRFIVGTSIGTAASCIPLGISAILLISRAAEEAFSDLPPSLKDLGKSLGASPYRILWKIYLPEALPTLVGLLTSISVTIVGFSSMAGTVGGGGLGDLAIRYGYQRYNTPFMVMIIALIVFLVQGIQLGGTWLSKKMRH